MKQPHIRLDESLNVRYAILPGDPARLDRIAQQLEGVRELLHKRRDNPVLQTGYLEVEAVDADTLRITRCAREGKDVFGEPLAGKAVMVKVSRK